MHIFEPILKFFDSLVDYLSYNAIFVIFAGLFLIVTIYIIIATTKAYEVRLIKAIDAFNNYFMDNPQITEENLVPFNQRMKSKKVPKQLRKQWQQYVLYREQKASYYMSFENCVANPLKNSSFKRDLTIYNILTSTLALISLILNVFFSFEFDNISALLQHCLLTPATIIFVSYIVKIFLEIRHSAVVSDLFQNYQYFESNIDKATTTLPDYVDYEVLFDKTEIKKGIPILYAYLSKRAEQEQRELEMARLKNVEHEQFNFDEAGVAGSLVLERAMQEAENYIAERKKYNQDTEQINADITQEELNYREITKEYNRQMQVSRETFENFKSQLNEVSSTIEANYLKKQQQQELDRQRNLERDFDTQTERHKKVLESFQAELDSVDNFRISSRKTLEEAMMSEFKTYHTKVYEEAKRIAEEKEREKLEKVKAQVRELEETIVSKNIELENVYAENQSLSEQLSSVGENIERKNVYTPETPVQQPEQVTYQPEQVVTPEPVQQPDVTEIQSEVTEQPEEQPQVYVPLKYVPLQKKLEDEEPSSIVDEVLKANEDVEKVEDINNESDKKERNHKSKYFSFDEDDEDDEPKEIVPENNNLEEEKVVESEEVTSEEEQKDLDSIFDKYFNNDSEEDDNVEEESEEESDEEEDTSDDLGNIFAKYFKSELEDKEENVSAKESEESKVVLEGEEQPKRKAGRPRKIVDKDEEEVNVPKKRGRPRKIDEEKEEQPKRKAGRPRKIEVEAEQTKTAAKRRGRPRKEEAETNTLVKRKAGRPKKTEIKEEKKTSATKGRGRPKKVVTEEKQTKVAKTKGRGRPRKEAIEAKPASKRSVGRPKKQTTVTATTKKKAGRPKKSSSVDIDAYLKEIDNEIAKENAKIKQTRKELEKKTKISKNKK